MTAAPPAGHAAALLLWQITEKLLLNPVKMRLRDIDQFLSYKIT